MYDPQPDEQIEAIVAAFFVPPIVTEAEYEIVLRDVSAEMAA